MFWLSYECFSILRNAFLLKSAISSHNSCALGRRFVSVKLEDGKKEKVQKRLLLSNLKEIYEHFLIENPAVKVRFSAFAML